MMNAQTRLALDDTVMTSIIKMADGNPGALQVCTDMVKYGHDIDPHSMGGLDCPKCGARPMVVHDITGEQIPWPAWVCGTQNHHGDFRQSSYCRIKVQQTTVERLKEDIAEGIAKNERLLNETIEQQATIKNLEDSLRSLASDWLAQQATISRLEGELVGARELHK